MPARSNEFQKLITLINGCLNDSGRVTESAHLVDKTNGIKREVDVLISSDIAGYSVNISVEVTASKRKAGVEWVEQMHAKHAVLPTNKLVLVSRRGFYKSALSKAEFYGIEAITFEEAFETDWDLAARMTSLGTLAVTTINYKISAVCEDTDGERTFSPAKRNTTVFLPYRETPTDFDQMAKFFLFEPRVQKILDQQIENTTERSFTLSYAPQTGTYVQSSEGRNMSLLRLNIALEVKHTDTPIKFNVGRYRESEFAMASSSKRGTELYYVLMRKDGNHAEGLLFDDSGIRKITSCPSGRYSD